jgi:hypothetical protein
LNADEGMDLVCRGRSRVSVGRSSSSRVSGVFFEGKWNFKTGGKVTFREGEEGRRRGRGFGWRVGRREGRMSGGVVMGVHFCYFIKGNYCLILILI